jgi:7-carboxy-7-deazaguanine synthase
MSSDRPTRDLRLPVSEIFGPVAQGEGMLIGRPTVFVRLGGCDYRCRWCDSLFSVLPRYVTTWDRLTVPDVVAAVLGCLPPGFTAGHVTLSGGNPAIHPLGDLVDALHQRNIRVGIETQGSVLFGWQIKVDDLTLSPKPPSSGNPTPFGDGTPLRAIVDRARLFRQRVCLKVVCFDDADYRYATEVHTAYPDIAFYVQAGTETGTLAAEADPNRADRTPATRDDMLATLAALQDRVCADPAMQDVAVLPQLHAILHGHKRGI